MDKKRVMVVHGAQPLSSARVRVIDERGQASSELRTDEDGQLVLESDRERLQLEVWLEQGWQRHSLELGEGPNESLFVLDVPAATDAGLSPQSGPGLDSFSGSYADQQFGDRYVIESRLGRGGMGLVVRAQDTLLDRPVAIKMLNDEFADNAEAQRLFLIEARSIATLSHPNLVGIYDVTMIESRAVIVFEYVEGEDLDELLAAQGALGEADVLRVAVQMARALRYLHGEGLIHRDIKPANVLIQGDGKLKIIDFGLARSLQKLEIRGTRIRGTPAYMAPEQVEGSDLLTATDVYQLGVMLYELAAGELPFSSGSMGYAHLHMEPPPLQERAPEIDPQLVETIHACLAKDPELRPTAAELFEGFREQYLDHQQQRDPAGEDALQLDEKWFFAGTREIRIDELKGQPGTSDESIDAHAPNAYDLSGERAGVTPMSQGRDDLGVRSLWLMVGGILGLVAIALVLVVTLLIEGPEERGQEGEARTSSPALATETAGESELEGSQGSLERQKPGQDEPDPATPAIGDPQPDAAPAAEAEDAPDAAPGAAASKREPEGAGAPAPEAPGARAPDPAGEPTSGGSPTPKQPTTPEAAPPDRPSPEASARRPPREASSPDPPAEATGSDSEGARAQKGAPLIEGEPVDQGRRAPLVAAGDPDAASHQGAQGFPPDEETDEVDDDPGQEGASDEVAEPAADSEGEAAKTRKKKKKVIRKKIIRRKIIRKKRKREESPDALKAF